MLDILLLRKDLDTAIARLETRKKPQAFLDVSAFQALESERKTLQSRTEELQAQRNQRADTCKRCSGPVRWDARKCGVLVHPAKSRREQRQHQEFKVIALPVAKKEADHESDKA